MKLHGFWRRGPLCQLAIGMFAGQYSQFAVGRKEMYVRIPVVEGENKRTDRNRHALVITAHKVKMNIPAGSEVDITIEIDQSRLVRAKAYIPILDEEFEEVLDLKKVRPKPPKVECVRIEDTSTDSQS